MDMTEDYREQVEETELEPHEGSEVRSATESGDPSEPHGGGVEDPQDLDPKEERPGGASSSPDPVGPDVAGTEDDPTEAGSNEEGGELDSAALQEELERLRDQHLRLAADFENYRKRANTELTSVWTRARADLVRSLVEGLDDLQRVSRFTSEDTTVEALIEGVDLVERNLLKALTEAGLEVLDPVGERFDPNCMEAMMRVEVDEEGEDETVHQVFQKGYMFKDQLVRPARVSVYKDDD